MATVHELFYDPLRLAYDEGRWIAPIGGHSDHVHVSFADPQSALQIIQYAKSLGLRVGENPYTDNVEPGVHVGSSYHYKNFPGKYNGRLLGMAADVSGSSAQMGTFAKWVAQTFTSGGNSVSSLAAVNASPSEGGSVAPSPSDLAGTGVGCLVVLAVQLAALGGSLGGLVWWAT